MDIASDVVELFLTRDPARAQALAEKLDRLNVARRESEANALDAIDRELRTLLVAADSAGSYPAECLILDHPDWHRGVLGILASRVVDRTGRPALVLTHADGDAHGSGRSIPGFHLLDALTASDTVDPSAPLFHRFGGHAHAVGFTLPSSRLSVLRDRMKTYAASILNTEMLIPQFGYDAELTLPDITPDLESWIARCSPFGIGNPEPVFMTRGATLAAPVRMIQEKHICLQLTQPELSPAGAAVPAISALGWSRGSINGPAQSANWLAQSAALALVQGSVIDLLYRIRRNTGPYASGQFGGLELELCAVRCGRSCP